MTITSLGELSVGATLTATTSATAAVSASVGLALPEATAKLAGYTLLSVPSPSFDMSAQLALTAAAYASALAELTAYPGGAGVALAAALTAGVAAQAAAQLAVKGLDPALALKIDAALAGKAALDVQASAGVSGPNINLALIADMIATLTATVGTLEAQADIAASISANLGVGGLKVYRFDGDISTAGSELQAQISADGLSGSFHFVVMLPTTAPAWSALQATIKTS